MRALLHTSLASTQAIKIATKRGAGALALGILALALQGCSMSGRSLEKSTTELIAITETRSTIAPDPFADNDDADATERDRLRDEDTMRDAVTSANLETSGALAWANESTGSSGMINEIAQRKVAGQTCRTFSATRQSYDGVTLYQGDLCLDPRTGWWTRKLAPVGLDGDA